VFGVGISRCLGLVGFCGVWGWYKGGVWGWYNKGVWGWYNTNLLLFWVGIIQVCGFGGIWVFSGNFEVFGVSVFFGKLEVFGVGIIRVFGVGIIPFSVVLWVCRRACSGFLLVFGVIYRFRDSCGVWGWYKGCLGLV